MPDPKDIYAATYGAVFAHLSLDNQRQGRAVTEDDLEAWADEANAVALNAKEMYEERHG